MERKILSVDIGGSKIIVGLVDENGRVLQCDKKTLPQTFDVPFLTNTIVEMAKAFLLDQPTACGITIPGLADAEKGVWKYAPFSGIEEFPIAEILEKQLNLPVFVENDVNACALAEKRFGSAKADKNFFWMTVSNGIGGAVFLEDKLFTGEQGNAGEIGHFIVGESTGRKCGCGRIGCLETLASGRGIAQNYTDATGVRVDAKTLSILAREGDRLALSAFETAGAYMGKALAYLINLLNIKNVYVGGGVSDSLDLLLPSIQKSLADRLFLQSGIQPNIAQTGLGYHAALIGAVTVALGNLEK